MRTLAVLGSLVFLLVGCDDASPMAGADAGSTPDAAAADAGVDAGAFELATEPRIPAATGACPDFHSGERVTVSPSGAAAREVRVWLAEDAGGGPLVFYWHGAGGRPDEAPFALGEALDAIVDDGGVVVGMTSDPGSGDFPWYLTTGSEETDLIVADEVVACAVEQVGVDPMRIHSVGFSAGALHNSQFAIRRASYLASVIVYSGGVIARRRLPTDEPNARIGALLFHGGPSDVVLTPFDEATETYRGLLEAMGHFAVVCDHGNGHTIPPAEGVASAWKFLRDHPYGSSPSPYAGVLPEGFYGACQL